MIQINQKQCGKIKVKRSEDLVKHKNKMVKTDFMQKTVEYRETCTSKTKLIIITNNSNTK